MPYIGSAPTKVVSRQSATVYRYTATAGQTVFSGADLDNAVLACNPADMVVHMNGIRLESTDYTATSTSVTLVVAAAAGDEVTVTSFQTFEVADTYDKATADTRYVNASGDTMTGGLNVTGGNLLVGKTDTTFSTAGFVLSNQYDVFQATRDQGNPVELNRTTSDGDIIKFYKDGTTVGSISTGGGNTEYGSANAVSVRPNSGTSATGNIIWGQGHFKPWNNAYFDLGDSTYKWKDAYLSGGVYLGGTGAANHLDDYEEGTWTPSLSSGSASTYNFTYIKIGKVVHITGYLSSLSGFPNSILTISGLPFVGNANYQMSLLWYNGSASVIAAAYLPYNSSALQVRPIGGQPSTFSELSVQMTYRTA